MAKAFLSIGTNIGERLENLNDALRGLAASNQIKITNVSSVYETDAVGYEDQAAFLNIAAEIETNFTPVELLDFCLALELELGRVRLFKWGPRLIDIDVLLYDNVEMDTEKLEIPHPYMKERAFVMIPLIEISPEKSNLLDNTAILEEQGVRKIKNQVNW
ncbi:2-amino-4-hydroxy-6-hydroxymethyldihydropteridine diphosphokinase [Listeria cossartiae subsp. cayugensis]|uniref:2-amino-4-hydroxy-6-hydroxymethyldihydropteridine diphosphokinase n=1 Tax=Listeria cossartiae subsp. cayugensis TaxID=2713505 RepID=A0ABU2IRN2_9LIST|nr:2-amino-4-hydroxy-6-hydroxymethyldihydropteridine diphosphokinase [Listeria cossartiae]MDT0050783.1 2-amino-4-hydroxy-6-hydroxymethyldihydropteridine diphosphokinase [Listeria cossartiae subsp. cayugensis]MDT0067355.1 2-amino-4-hydroxy-6-hydroxymethyldihydropteridine diphosphokinase [Listeria cossartiae subsp. cayugensis]MDT0081243.1 2-amino-4-hydroxy-6-hydroxymethyldihydropteridine diphosphokinase [Listeria cossartiae subsp. cayugensis]MDT0084079.1 2-amino-4-hydroxy-6-hydroxymethyldihydropt